ncbi:MAG: YggS family pyridoxal phosphate-dependent enzyme [Ruminococcaceae bacterium]|nr:YggS family pyridoxal phosphate-dependent enzyme [Oscillospiraceae bacterium]
MMEKSLSNTQTSFSDIKESYEQICADIKKVMAEAGRTDEVKLMAVTKTVDTERVNYAIGLGVDLLGENRVQEFLDKREGYKPAEVHFIGGLQTNKVKYIIDKVTMIHSVDSVRLAQEISRRAAQHGKIMDILVEVNIGEEDTKGGISPQSVRELCSEVISLPNIRLRGLMTIPPPWCSEEIFAAMQKLFEDIKAHPLPNSSEDNFKFDTLSMGMSGDYATAIKYGSTIIRIGSGLFGYRKYTNN